MRSSCYFTLRTYKTFLLIFFLAFCSHLCSHETTTQLWEGEFVHLEDRQGFLLVAPKRSVTLRELSNSEKVELESTVGKMERVFEKAFGFGDFMRWMPCGEEPVAAYLFPAGGWSDGNGIDVEHKLRAMLWTLSEEKEALLSLTKEKISKIEKAAQEVLSLSEPPLSVDYQEYSVDHLPEAFSLLKEVIIARGGQCDLQWQEGFEWPKGALSPVCKVFCNEEIINRQSISETCLHHVVCNPRPYVDHHFMVIPKRHISAISENSSEEILDKYSLFICIDEIARRDFGVPKVAIVTRRGSRGGQTQPHLHDHVLGYHPDRLQSWMIYGAYESSSKPLPPLSDEQMQAIRKTWQPLIKINIVNLLNMIFW